MEKTERYLGALLGLAIGDALGSPVEFEPPGSFAPVRDMMGGGPFNLEPGQWSDDTSMALCLAASLIEKRGFDPIDQLEKYLKWYREGYMSSVKGRCVCIGPTTEKALLLFEKTREPYCGTTDPKMAGNGSLMRLAPIPLLYAGNPVEAIEKSKESSRTTHGAATCADACRYFGALIVGAVNGASREELLSERYSPVAGYWKEKPLVPEIDEIAMGSFKSREPPKIAGTGHVVKSLEAALWAFHRGSSFGSGCLLAVNLGNDADTTAAVYGQLAGAFYGARAIPSIWKEKLAYRELIESLAVKLFELANPEPFPGQREENSHAVPVKVEGKVEEYIQEAGERNRDTE